MTWLQRKRNPHGPKCLVARRRRALIADQRWPWLKGVHGGPIAASPPMGPPCERFPDLGVRPPRDPPAGACRDRRECQVRLLAATWAAAPRAREESAIGAQSVYDARTRQSYGDRTDPLATRRCQPRQARKGATVAATLCAGVWWVRSPPTRQAVFASERCPSGRRSTPGKRVWVNSSSRVRIPPSPPSPLPEPSVHVRQSATKALFFK